MNIERQSSHRITGQSEPVPDELQGTWHHINQHFLTTQSSLRVKLISKGKEVASVEDVKSGVRDAARMFALQNSPGKAAERIVRLSNDFDNKCKQWQERARSLESQLKAAATGGSGRTGPARPGQRTGSSAADERKRVEAEHNRVRIRMTEAKQCFRRLRTALNRGAALWDPSMNHPVQHLSDLPSDLDAKDSPGSPDMRATEEN